MQNGEALPKAPPNDPQRQGNIWHRYEQLENMTKSLAGVNQQMVMEKAKHQRVRVLYLSGALCSSAGEGSTSGSLGPTTRVEESRRLMS